MKKTLILYAALCMAALSCLSVSLKTGATADDALRMVYVPSNGVPNYVEYDTNVWIAGTLTNIRWHSITYTYTAGEVLSRVLESYTVAGATSYALNVSGAVSPADFDAATNNILSNAYARTDQMTIKGVLNMSGYAITNLGEPPTAKSAATKQYVDGATNGCFQTNSQVAVATAEGFLRSCDSSGANLIFDSIYYNSWHIVPINNSDAELLENVWGWSVQATKMSNAFACSLGNSLLSTSVVTQITIHTRSAASGWTPCTITNTFNHLFITTNTATRTDILSLTSNNMNTFLTEGNWVLEQTNGLPRQNTTVAWKLQLQGVGGGTGMITSIMYKWLK